ncbi:MAG TPA: hypothetical protein PKY35_04900 [Candidatus Hydrogenedentes bacterium]|nr:hypothetical protein [Candidatus Hydrogenedentota bacterium]HOL76348.1 hypothetical protein [Candidatus Hydrogenedentota bacterium]HPO86175.1 hypothetical protein [Candidatus Hydrogenedentota bacterium]
MTHRLFVVSAVIVVAFTFMVYADEVLDLSEGWRFAPDPENVGHEQGWFQTDFDDASWAVVNAGHWEDQGFSGLDGAAWYRMRFRIPEGIKGKRIWFNTNGIDNWGEIFCNGKKLKQFGNDKVSYASRPTTLEITSALSPDAENVLALRVVDVAGLGGIHAPCNLTTAANPRVLEDLLRLVPGFSGRPTLVGVWLPVEEVREPMPQVNLSLFVNDKPVDLSPAEIATDDEGRPAVVARAVLTPAPGDVLTARAEILDESEKSMFGAPLETKFVWPKPPRWEGEYRHLRVLNNFVTELKSIRGVPAVSLRVPFLVPRDGWLFISLQKVRNPYGELDNSRKPLVWRKNPETGVYEVMQYLSKGRHVLLLKRAAGANLDIRAVPEIAFCYWPTKPILTGLPPRDHAYGERYIFPNMNVLLTHDDMTAEEFELWRAEGRRWLMNSSLPGLHDDTPPTADAVYEEWTKNACLKRPGYSGIIVDEFLSSSADHYRAWTEATERLIHNPAFAGQTFYAWVVNTYRHPPGLEYMQKLYSWGGKFAWERYFHEEPSEDAAWLRNYHDMVTQLQEWEQLMPNLKERLSICLGSFSTPSCSLNIDPNTDFLSHMDIQFELLATDPTFFGVYGIFQWAAHYTDDDALRYAMKLYRHYCIEGKRTRYSQRPYRLSHVLNADFKAGLEHWDSAPAETDSITVGERRGLGKIQGRWTGFGPGDTCAIFTRSAAGPNRLSQTITHLTAGALYSLKYIASDLDNLGKKEEVGLFAELDKVEIVEEKSFRTVMPSSYALKFENFDRNNRAYTTYVQVVFRAQEETAKLQFSDWKDGVPAGPISQKIAFNFVEVQPYFEE